MSLLFLQFIRVFVTSQMATAPLRTASWTFCTFRSLLRSWVFIHSCQISLLHFFTGKSEQFCGFLYLFILVLNFSKALGFCLTLFSISVRYLLIFPLFLHLCQVFVLSILFRLPASSLSSLTWRLTQSSCSCSDSSPPNPL